MEVKIPQLPPPTNIFTTTFPQPPPQRAASTSTTDTTPLSQQNTIIIILLIITTVFLLSLSLHLLFRFTERRRRRSSSSTESRRVSDLPPSFHHQPNTTATATATAAINVPSHNNNISSEQQPRSNSLIDSLPIFNFNSISTGRNNLRRRLDCAVCLSPFQTDDQLRLLPYCTHAFHADCIGAWLISNTTCPLCRSDVAAAFAAEKDIDSSRKSSVGGRSFRLELGSISGRYSNTGAGISRTYSMGSFEYIVPETPPPEVTIDIEKILSSSGRGHHVISNCPISDLGSGYRPESRITAGSVAGGSSRNWLRDYLDRIIWSRSSSFRSGHMSEGRSRRCDGLQGSGRWVDESHSGRMMAAATESFLLFLRSGGM